MLIVADVEPVRTISAAILKRHGLTALIAADGEAALRLDQTETPPVTAMRPNLTMPRIAREETLRRLRVLNPAQNASSC